MSSEDNRAVRVTAEERQHPALRILARACIAIAREQLEQERQKKQELTATPQSQPDEPKEGPR